MKIHIYIYIFEYIYIVVFCIQKISNCENLLNGQCLTHIFIKNIRAVFWNHYIYVNNIFSQIFCTHNRGDHNLHMLFYNYEWNGWNGEQLKVTMLASPILGECWALALFEAYGWANHHFPCLSCTFEVSRYPSFIGRGLLWAPNSTFLKLHVCKGSIPCSFPNQTLLLLQQKQPLYSVITLPCHT